MSRARLRWLVAIIVAAFALAPLVAGNFTVSLMNDIGIGALVALGLVLLTGVGGARDAVVSETSRCAESAAH